jgi:4-alpha-glucanotransferase
MRIPEVELARMAGVQTEFTDMQDRQVRASREGLRAILSALGFPADSPRELGESLERFRLRKWRGHTEPVHVFWDGRAHAIKVRFPEACEVIQTKIVLEDGTVRVKEVRMRELKQVGKEEIRGTVHIENELPIPALPLGFHNIEVRSGYRWASSLLISAPSKAYSPEIGTTRWGVFAPAYALSSAGNWGAGNFSDLTRMARWAAGLGGKVLATLPVTATFLGSPGLEPSPYSPASRLFWNEFFVDLEKVPEFEACTKARQILGSRRFQTELSRLRNSPQVDYAAGMKLRREVLSELARHFLGLPRRKEFEAALANHPHLNDYASFRAVCDRIGKSWHCWPDRLKRGKIEQDDFAEWDWQYYAYAQWIAEGQMQDVSSECARLKSDLYLDLPLGAHPDSYDMWRHQDQFALKASVGAPPDSFFSKGQNWGFSPLNPLRMREHGYGHLRDCLRFQMRHASILRIDHVMALHRLYWIPHGLPGSEGAYVSYPAEELYALLCLESVRNKTILVGENLGTVPPEVNKNLERHAFRTMYVLPFEQRSGRRKVLKPPPQTSIASINTHDMPTFAAHATGADVEDRVALGLLQKSEARQQKASRSEQMDELRRFLINEECLEQGDETVGGLWQACAKWLAGSPAGIVLLNLEDFWEEMQPQNVPGTSSERPNWKRKLRFTIEEIEQMPELADFLSEVSKLRRRAMRAAGQSFRSGGRN